MKRLGPVFLLFLLVGFFGPLVRAVSENPNCCCPDGQNRCSARPDPCSWTSGCGGDETTSPVSLTVLVLPAASARIAPAPAGWLDPAPPAVILGLALSVPDPPPRS
jgi:hypothetical protein